MPIAITVPRLGWSMEEGTFSAWLKQPGESVEPGEMLFAIESDKVTMDVEALDGGVLHVSVDAPQPGDRVVPGQLLGYLLAPGEAPPDAKVPVTPRARRIARELDVDLKPLQGTGKGGRIRERDVRAAAPRQPQLPPSPSLRRTIASRMMRSAQNTAPVTLMRRVDATGLAAIRDADKQLSYTAILVKLTAQALAQHPLLASRWEDERIVPPNGMHIGIAVDTDNGLIVPVIRDADRLSIAMIADRVRHLAQAAHSRQLKPEEVEGGVFTITNLGAFGVEAFTPILNYPETAVLGMGAVQWEPVALGNGHLVTRRQITLSLTFDHRVLDGAPAARFLQTLTHLLTTLPQSAPHA